MIEKEIGKRIQECRKKKGMTQEQLAELINLSPNHLSALERGVYSVKLDTLVQIINILDCSADDLFCDVIRQGYKVKVAKMSDQFEMLSPKEQTMILKMIEVLSNT